MSNPIPNTTAPKGANTTEIVEKIENHAENDFGPKTIVPPSLETFGHVFSSLCLLLRPKGSWDILTALAPDEWGTLPHLFRRQLDAKIPHLSPRVVSNTLDALEDAELVARVVMREKPRYSLTPNGLQLLEICPKFLDPKLQNLVKSCLQKREQNHHKRL